MIDTHCHLNYEPLSADIPALLERAREHGVDRVIIPGTGRDTSDSAAQLAGSYPNVWAGVGIHPHDAEQVKPEDIERIQTLVLNPRVVAVGEVGLDYFHFEGLEESDIEARKALQKGVLLEMITIAKEHNKPLIIHSRDCFDDLYELLKQEAAGHPTVIHCFTGSAEEAKVWLDLGFHLSVTGIITYKNAEALRAVVKDIPWERLMIETDAPFLAPQPYRGKPCEPFMTALVAEQLAEIKGVDIEEVDERTTATAEAFFTLNP